MGERRTLTLPYSEVAMHMRVAGTTMAAELVPTRSSAMVQLLDGTGRPFSFPITQGEAGWGRVGSDHTLTRWDEDGRWHAIEKVTVDA